MTRSGRRLGAAALLLAAAVGSGAGDAEATVPAELRINEIQVLGTHNSYRVEPPSTVLDAFIAVDPDAINLRYSHEPLTVQLDELGIRQFELDLVFDPDGTLFRPLGTPGWKVLHIEQLDEGATCETLIACLTELRTWSDEHQAHVPLTVLVEFKVPNPAARLDKTPPVTPESLRDFDAEVRSVFPPERLITPDDVRADHPSLREAVLAGAWPTVDDSRGKVMFVLNDHRREYVAGDTSLSGRVAFPNSAPPQPDAAFMLLNDPIGDDDTIRDAVASGYLVRTRADVPVETVQSGDTTRRDAAFESGAQFVSTDFPRDGVAQLRWGTEYVVQLPGDGSARCNPVSAPPHCDSTTIEIL